MESQSTGDGVMGVGIGVEGTVLQPKKRRIRFSTQWDTLLLKTVTSCDAHLAPHGDAQSRFQEALGHFIAAIPHTTFEMIQMPTWKTLNDRFKKLVSDHRAAVRTNAAASGIVEVRGEREILLDDIVQAVDELEEQRRAERDERTKLDQRLTEAGERIRSSAVGMGTNIPRVQLPSSSTPELTASPAAARNVAPGRKRQAPQDSDDEDMSAIDQHIQVQREGDAKQMKLDEDRLALEKVRMDREDERFRRRDEIDLKKVAIDQKRIELAERKEELERTERQATIDERKQMISLLQVLVKKLE